MTGGSPAFGGAGRRAVARFRCEKRLQSIQEIDAASVSDDSMTRIIAAETTLKPHNSCRSETFTRYQHTVEALLGTGRLDANVQTSLIDAN
jgi:DNA integrity scanning protein DisA with diadenylate cyclase activity